jgi:hypothetical protein
MGWKIALLHMMHQRSSSLDSILLHLQGTASQRLKVQAKWPKAAACGEVSA